MRSYTTGLMTMNVMMYTSDYAEGRTRACNPFMFVLPIIRLKIAVHHLIIYILYITARM